MDKERKRAYNVAYYAEHKDENAEAERARKLVWSRANRDYLNSKGRAYHRGLRRAALDHYGNKCVCCGEWREEFLAIDHANGDGADHRKEMNGNLIYRWLKKNGYPDGFRVLCHNCNSAMGFYGYCPHQREDPAWLKRLITASRTAAR